MNPNKLVTTYDGTTALRKDCNHIQGKLYIRNKQCFLVESKWNRINNGKIVFDHELKQWIKKSSINILREGIVNLTPNGKVELGFYTPNPLKNVIIGNCEIDNVYRGTDCISEEIALKLGLEEAILDNNFYQTSLLTKDNLKVLNTKIVPQRNSTYRFPFEYSSDRMIPDFIPFFEKYFCPKVKLSNIKRLKFLEKYQWGVEFETSKGTIPERFLWPNGLIACRDGSITGFEYVTIPLKGKSGIEAIYNNSILLKKYTEISLNNALHIHIGNYPVNMKSVLAIYRLSTRIQNEIFSIFPSFYHNTSIFKGKSYCGPLPNISSSTETYKESFLKLYEKILQGDIFEGFNVSEHPMDASGRHKWNVNPRYKWLNIIPLVFGRKKTVEFRIHTPTLNAQKVIYWLFISVAILEFARKYQSQLIHKIISVNTSLESIITSCYNSDPYLTNLLLDYIKLRKSWFRNGKDADGRQEVILDDSFTIEPIV